MTHAWGFLRIPVEINARRAASAGTMAMPAFDTHKAVKELCSAGFDDAQAEAVVDQIHGAVNENVATKTDIEKLVTREELREAIAKLATKTDLEQFATKTDIEKFATREELRRDVADLDNKLDRLDTKLDNAVERLDTKIDNAVVRLRDEIEKQGTRHLRNVVVVVGAFVGLSKAFDVLFT